MYRIADPERSIDFYTRVLGMRCAYPCVYKANLSAMYYKFGADVYPSLNRTFYLRYYVQCAGC